MNLQLIGVICNMISRKGNGLIGEEQNYMNNLNRSNFLTFKSMIRENKTSHAIFNLYTITTDLHFFTIFTNFKI